VTLLARFACQVLSIVTKSHDDVAWYRCRCAAVIIIMLPIKP
jgi:hypothetical protein